MIRLIEDERGRLDRSGFGNRLTAGGARLLLEFEDTSGDEDENMTDEEASSTVESGRPLVVFVYPPTVGWMLAITTVVRQSRAETQKSKP